MSGRVSRAAGLDFDGVIRDGTVAVPGAAAAIAALMAVRPVYVCTTVRPAEAAAFLSALGFETETDESCPLCPGTPGCPCCGGSGEVIWWTDRSRLLVTSRKLPGVLVDDRAVTFRSWPQALAELEGEPGMSEVPPAAMRAEAVAADLAEIGRCPLVLSECPPCRARLARLGERISDLDATRMVAPAEVIDLATKAAREAWDPATGTIPDRWRNAITAALAAAAPHLAADHETAAVAAIKAEASAVRELEAIAADLAAVLEGYGCPVPGHEWDAYCPRCQVFARWRTVKEAGS